MSQVDEWNKQKEQSFHSSKQNLLKLCTNEQRQNSEEPFQEKKYTLTEDLIRNLFRPDRHYCLAD